MTLKNKNYRFLPTRQNNLKPFEALEKTALRIPTVHIFQSFQSLLHPCCSFKGWASWSMPTKNFEACRKIALDLSFFTLLKPFYIKLLVGKCLSGILKFLKDLSICVKNTMKGISKFDRCGWWFSLTLFSSRLLLRLWNHVDYVLLSEMIRDEGDGCKITSCMTCSMKRMSLDAHIIGWTNIIMNGVTS